MRITRQQADANKARVVETAASLFREKGFDRVSVADLMQAAGLTHGGFYNHFGSKDDLEAAACAHIFGKSVSAIRQSLRSPSRKRAKAVDAYKRQYASKKGRDADAARCPMVAFAGDVSRQSPSVRRNMRWVCINISTRLSALWLSKTKARRARQQAIAQFAALAGALTLARSVADADPVLSDEILEAAVAALDPATS